MTNTVEGNSDVVYESLKDTLKGLQERRAMVAEKAQTIYDNFTALFSLDEESFKAAQEKKKGAPLALDRSLHRLSIESLSSTGMLHDGMFYLNMAALNLVHINIALHSAEAQTQRIKDFVNNCKSQCDIALSSFDNWFEETSELILSKSPESNSPKALGPGNDNSSET